MHLFPRLYPNEKITGTAFLSDVFNAGTETDDKILATEIESWEMKISEIATRQKKKPQVVVTYGF